VIQVARLLWIPNAKYRSTKVMVGEQENSSEIARSLEDGWHYQPDWRNRVVEAYLIEHGADVDPLTVLGHEHDPYARQYYAFRRTGGSLGRDAFRWAYRCHAHDASTGAAAMVKAMTLARVPVKDIAKELRTKSQNVIVFQKVYFDVERYLDEREWLASIVFAGPQDAPTLAEFRQQHWLAAALIGGRKGLERAISRNNPITNEERDRLVGEIRSALTVRAHDYIASLRSGLVQPGAEDFDRLLRMLDVGARQPTQENRDGLMQTFVQAIHAEIQVQSRLPENAEDPVFAAVRESADQVNDEQAGGEKAA
jgi:hypothetical protein